MMCLNHCKALKVSGRRNMFLQLQMVLSRSVSHLSAGSLDSYYFARLAPLERRGSCFLPLPLTSRAVARPCPHSSDQRNEGLSLPLQRPSCTSEMFSSLPALPRVSFPTPQPPAPQVILQLGKLY